MKGYNLPDDTGPNDPDAPWNKTADSCKHLDDYDWDEEQCSTCGLIWNYCVCNFDDLQDEDPRKKY